MVTVGRILFVLVLEPAETAKDEGTVDRGDDRLDDGRLEKTGLLPLGDGRLAEELNGPSLAGDGQDQKVALRHSPEVTRPCS